MSGVAPFVSPSYIGNHDDGTSEGLARIKLAQGELVKVGISSANTYSANVGGSNTWNLAGAYQNSDGSSASVVITTASYASSVSALSGSGGYIQKTIYGKVVGVRFHRTSTPPFCVDIDGVASLVRQPLAFNGVYYGGSSADDEAFFIVADDLPDGPHTVRVILTNEPASSAGYSLTFYGFLAERRAGYADRTKMNDVSATGTLATSAVAVPRANEAYIRGVLYTNTSASAVTVTVQYSGTTIWQAVLAAAGSAGCSATFDVLAPTALGVSHLASTASAVNFAVLGANF